MDADSIHKEYEVLGRVLDRVIARRRVDGRLGYFPVREGAYLPFILLPEEEDCLGSPGAFSGG